jgi:hypothetical protein
MSQMTPLKMIRATLVSAIFRQFGSCFWTFSSPCQKQELPVAAMFVNGSGRNEQSL